jgi:hypothetical protein
MGFENRIMVNKCNKTKGSIRRMEVQLRLLEITAKHVPLLGSGKLIPKRKAKKTAGTADEIPQDTSSKLEATWGGVILSGAAENANGVINTHTN